MRIAIVCERFDPNAGGLEGWCDQFVRRLTERGHEVHVVTFDVRVSGNDVPVFHRLAWRASRLARARAVKGALPAIGADVIHDLGVGWTYDVLHPQGGSRLANLRGDLRSLTVAERARKRLRPRFWWWARELREIERRQYSRRDGVVIAVSEMVAGHLRDLHGVEEERIRTIPNGVDTKRFSPERGAAERAEARRGLGVGDDETLFLFVAHNVRLKGVRPLLHAMEKVRRTRPTCRLATIGCAPDAELRRTAARLGLERATLFAGFVDDPFPFYAAADAFVLPTYYDACSLTALEAAASGLPVITTRCNGAGELFTSGRDGIILDDPEDTVALAGALARLADPAVRNEMSAAARSLALRNGLDRNVAAIENVYREIAHRW